MSSLFKEHGSAAFDALLGIASSASGLTEQQRAALMTALNSGPRDQAVRSASGPLQEDEGHSSSEDADVAAAGEGE